MKLLSRFSIALTAIMFASYSPAKDAPAKAATPTLPENHAKIFTLENGVTIIVDEDHSAPVASVQAWCGTGSIHEGKQLGAGLSHILEHMLFKGTEKRKVGDISRQVQEQGGYINAYTSFDRTVYWIDVPAAGAGEAVDILADAMMNATLPEDEYIKEQEVIRREFAMGFDDPNRQSSLLMLRTVFSESPFKHPVIGYLDVYNKLTRQDVLDYYKKRYVPNNLTFVVVGDVDAAAIRDQLEKFFEKYPRQALEPVYIASEPEQVGRREKEEEFPTELSRLALAWRIPGLTNPDTPALELLGDILGSGRSSLLNQEIREKQRLAPMISAGMYSMQTEGVFIIQSVCEPDKRKKIELESLAIVERIKKEGVSAEELEKSRRSLLSAQLNNLGTMRGRASDLGSNWLLTQNLDFSKDYLDHIAKVTPEDIRRVAQKYLRNDALNVTSLNPIGSLETKAVADTQPKRGEVQKFELPNGLRLLVVEDPRLPLVSLSATFRGGLLAETKENNGITKLLARTMLKGTKTRSAAQIAEEIESVGGGIASDSGNNTFNVSVDVMKPDVALGLDVLSDVVLNPTFPDAEVSLEKDAQLASIKTEEEQPTVVARNEAREKLFGNHPYSLRANGRVDSVASLDSKQLAAFHKALTVGANGVIAVVGDVKADEIRKLVEQDFAKLPKGELALSAPAKPEALTKGSDTTVEKNKQQAVLMIAYPGADITSPDRPVLEVINEASNDLGSRFFNRIREQMGLAYYVGAGNLSGLSPGFFLFYLGTDPQKIDVVTKEFQSEIAKLAADGLTEEELVRAKKKLLGEEAIKNQSNGAFASTIATDELMGLGADNYKKRADEINSVTLDQAKQVSAKYFSTPDHVQVTVRPPVKAATTAPAAETPKS